MDTIRLILFVCLLACIKLFAEAKNRLTAVHRNMQEQLDPHFAGQTGKTKATLQTHYDTKLTIALASAAGCERNAQ